MGKWVGGVVRATAAVGLALMAAAPARAHIEYYDLNQGVQIADLTAAGKALRGNDLPISNPAYWTSQYQSTTTSGETWKNSTGSYSSGTWGRTLHVANLDSSAWTDGLRNNAKGGANLLGDTHKVDFANFHLSTASFVSITLTDDMVGSGYGLNPSFSIYKGLAVYQGHDGVPVDPLNPVSTSPPFPKVQNAKDTGSVVDSQGITSAYRNTLTNSGLYYGQFDATGSWSVGNAAGNWSAVSFVTAVTGTVNPSGDWSGNPNSNSLLSYLLPAGDYIIAFGGNAQLPSYSSARSADSTSPYGTVTNLGGTLTFNAVAAPVPEPDSYVLMAAGLALIAGAIRRRSCHPRL
jgi:hypothetical protein